MSEEASDFPDIPEVPTDAAPRVRRISNKRPKKSAEPAAEVEEILASAAVEPAPVVEPAAAEPAAAEPVAAAPAAEPEETDEADEAPSLAEWAEPETSGGSSSESAKRKRRRKKGKGTGAQTPQVQEVVMPLVTEASAPAEDAPEPPASRRESNPPRDREERAERQERQERPERQERQDRQERPDRQERAPQPAPQPRTKVDPEELAKRAWKIYLAEVSEEGVALIGDADARELSRRCFRLAEIFIEEQARRR